MNDRPIDASRDRTLGVGRLGRGVLLGAAAAGLAVGGAGVASAASPGVHGAAAHPPKLQRNVRRRDSGLDGHLIHKQWTTETHAGTFDNYVEQIGTVAVPTSSAPTSAPTTITVTSADNFSETYTIATTTHVSPRGATIANGDTVVVMGWAGTAPAGSSSAGSATSGTSDTAVFVHDLTAARAGDSSGGGRGDGGSGGGGSGRGDNLAGR